MTIDNQITTPDALYDKTKNKTIHQIRLALVLSMNRRSDLWTTVTTDLHKKRTLRFQIKQNKRVIMVFYIRLEHAETVFQRLKKWLADRGELKHFQDVLPNKLSQKHTGRKEAAVIWLLLRACLSVSIKNDTTCDALCSDDEKEAILHYHPVPSQLQLKSDYFRRSVMTVKNMDVLVCFELPHVAQTKANNDTQARFQFADEPKTAVATHAAPVSQSESQPQTEAPDHTTIKKTFLIDGKTVTVLTNTATGETSVLSDGQVIQPVLEQPETLTCSKCGCDNISKFRYIEHIQCWRNVRGWIDGQLHIEGLYQVTDGYDSGEAPFLLECHNEIEVDGKHQTCLHTWPLPDVPVDWV